MKFVERSQQFILFSLKPQQFVVVVMYSLKIELTYRASITRTALNQWKTAQSANEFTTDISKNSKIMEAFLRD